MDIRSMQQTTQEKINKRFGRKKYLKSRAVPRYPQSAEREYIRVVNAYMKLLNNIIAEYIPKIRKALSFDMLVTDAIGDEPAPTIDSIFDEILTEFITRQGLFGLRRQIEKISNLNRKLTISEWKRVVKRTLGIDIMSDYYNGVKFQQLFDKWVVDNVEMIKNTSLDTIIKMRNIIKQGYLSGTATKSISGKITDLNPSDFGFKSEMSFEAYQKAMAEYNKAKRHAQFIARDQISKLNAQITREQHLDAGVTEYVWRTVDDSRVRSSHRKLNNRRFKYSEPPVVDESTGRRANPGEDYQCRCVALPVFDIDGVVLPWEKSAHDTKM